MKVPILIHYKPVTNAVSSLVYLIPGHWKIESDHKDSELFLTLSSGAKIKLENGVDFTGTGNYSIEVIKQGTEKAINVYAIKVD